MPLRTISQLNRPHCQCYPEGRSACKKLTYRYNLQRQRPQKIYRCIVAVNVHILPSPCTQVSESLNRINSTYLHANAACPHRPRVMCCSAAVVHRLTWNWKKRTVRIISTLRSFTSSSHRVASASLRNQYTRCAIHLAQI